MNTTVTLENQKTRVKVTTLGGKILSLFNKENQSEWLYQSETSPALPEKQDTFKKEYAYGYDEMFPNIVPESSTQTDGSKIDLPDHGEIWSRIWTITDQTEDSVEMSIQGELLPYKFVRSIVVADCCIICRYWVINLSDTDFPALWTPHPLFSFFEESEILLPPGADSIIQAGNGGDLGSYGTKIKLGEQGFVEGTGKLLLPGSLHEGSAYKFYFAEPVKPGNVSIKDRRGILSMKYPAHLLPWLGLWINNGGWGDQYNIAPEPATSPFDSPAGSEEFGVAAVWKAGDIREWEIHIILET